MINRLTPRKIGIDPKSADEPPKSNQWPVVFAVATCVLTPVMVQLTRAFWRSPVVFDLLQVLLVFSVIMIGVGLWRANTAHRRSRPFDDASGS